MSVKPEIGMVIDGELDQEHVVGLSNALSAASDAYHVETGKGPHAREIIEASLCALCDTILQAGKNEADRAYLAQHAMRFIMRNSRANSSAILNAFVAEMRAIEVLPTQGTA